MRVLLVVGVIAQLLRLFALAFVPPILQAAWDKNWAELAYFLAPLFLTLAVSAATSRLPGHFGAIRRAEALAVVSGTWLAIALVGALPYAFSGLHPVDALFESMSGFTTTGATILSDFESHGRAFFLWRAMTQWFGGMGVIALFVVVLPRLGIAGRQLFFAEASRAPSEAVSPSAQMSARRLWLLYVGLTLLLALGLRLAGMSGYDAVVHSLATLSAGGFSPHPSSVAGYANPAAEWILCLFMILSGTSFTLLYKAVSGRPLVMAKDGEFGLYMIVIVALTAFLSATISPGRFGEETIRTSLFQVTSLISSTGFASVDYNTWNDSSRALLIVAMVVGGCAASACGGPKVIRWLLVLKHVAREIKRTLHPRAIIAIKHKGATVSDEIMRSVFMLVVLFVVGHFVFGVLLVLLGQDLVVGFSASIACFGNVGPAFGIAGPMGSYAAFNMPSKLLLTFAMWVGRLEVVTVLALLHPDVLREIRLKN